MEHPVHDEMVTADELTESLVQYVKRNYEKFSQFSKEVSQGSWEEWLRNHLEAKIYFHGGLTKWHNKAEWSK